MKRAVRASFGDGAMTSARGNDNGSPDPGTTVEHASPQGRGAGRRRNAPTDEQEQQTQPSTLHRIPFDEPSASLSGGLNDIAARSLDDRATDRHKFPLVSVLGDGWEYVLLTAARIAAPPLATKRVGIRAGGPPEGG